MVVLSSGMGIEWLEVNSPAGLAVFLCTYNHLMAPCDRFTYGDYFNDTQVVISVKVCLDLLCQWMGTGTGEWCGYSHRVEYQLHGWAFYHG